MRCFATPLFATALTLLLAACQQDVVVNTPTTPPAEGFVRDADTPDAISTFATFIHLIVTSAIVHAYAVGQKATWADAVQYVSVLDQVRGFGSGQLDPRFLVLHLSVCVLMLYLTVKVVEYRREG